MLNLREIISSCPDNFLDGTRHQIAHRLAIPDAASDERGRDIHYGSIDEFNVRMRLKFGWLRAGAWIHIESVVFQDPFVIFPLDKIDQIVFAQYDLELPVGIFFRQMDERMNGIAGAGQVKFDISGFDFVIIIYCGANHIQAVRVAEKSLGGLERILRGDDKPHLVQVSGFRHDICDDQVPDVYRVEGAEKEADFQRVRFNFRLLIYVVLLLL